MAFRSAAANKRGGNPADPITVDTAGRDVNQFAEIDLAAGHEACAKALSLRSWLADDCLTWGGCDTFYVRLMPAEAARTAIARSPFYASS